jgi:hypothetical protein
MGNARFSVVALAIAGLALAAVGCGGGGGSGERFGIGFAPVDATLAQLETDLRSGVQLINGSITTATANIPNPNAAQIATTTAVNVSGGAGANNGTAGTVTVTVSVTRNPNGSGTIVTRVIDQASGHEFLKQTIANDAPDIRIRVPPQGTEGLQSDGEGQIFTIVRISTTGTVTNEFNNFTPAGVSLVAFGAQPVVPTGTTVSDFSGYEEFMVEYNVEIRGVQLEADIQEITPGSGQFTFARRGGPPTTAVDQALTTLLVGGAARDRTGDIVIPVGNDATSATGFDPNATLNLNGNITGGVTTATATPETVLADNITPADTPDVGTTFSYSGNLNSISTAPQNVIDVSSIRMETLSVEDPATLTHALDATLAGAAIDVGTVEDVLYLPSSAFKRTRIYLFR